MPNLIEEYYEYVFEFENKLNTIGECFSKKHDFKITFKDKERISMVRKNVFMEFYQDTESNKYVFDIYIDEDCKRLFTNNFDKIEKKIKEVEKIIQKEN